MSVQQNVRSGPVRLWRSKPSSITLADRARDVGKWEEAAHWYRRALERNPRRSEIWVQYGHALKEQGDLAEAERAYRTALRYEPGSADTYVQLGHLLKLLGRTEAAEGVYLRACALDPKAIGPVTELQRLGWTGNDLNELRRELQTNDDDIATAVSDLNSFATTPLSVKPLSLPHLPPRPGLQQLRDYLVDEEFGHGAPAAGRVLDYFRIIGALTDPGTGPESRATILAALTNRLRRLSEAAAKDSRPPVATIIIPVFNQIEYTLACAISLLEHRCDTPYEILVGNDASTDETRSVFDSVGGVVHCVTHENNQGFLGNCNSSTTQARGEYVVLLNNDTIILDYWLDELIEPFSRFNDIGLVGSKLLMCDGTLQEAGGIIWRDGSGWNFGRGQSPRGHEFNYLKDVDYVSGASVALPRALWVEMGGFDERYRPAYAEDTDLAFRIRERGLRTVYAPHSALIHHEGISHGRDISEGLKSYQIVNQKKFLEKWNETLAREHFPSGDHVHLARDRSRDRKHILVFDHYVPKVDRDGGSRLMYDLLTMLVDAGLHVSFWPDNGHYDREYARELQNLGIELLYGSHVPNGFREWIERAGPYVDYAFLHRPHVTQRYIDDLRNYSKASRIYYGSDLHFVRLQREFKLTGRAEILEEAESTRRLESYVWERSNVIYYPAPDEVAFVQTQMPNTPVRRFPVQIYRNEWISSARARIGNVRQGPPMILYVAGFGHHPNVDAILWFVREALPYVKAKLPDAVTIVAGSYPPRSVTNLARDDIVVTQAVSWPVLDWFYNSAHVVIAPMRYGGGMKGKILEAMRYGVPVVTTTAGAEGFDEPDDTLAIADTPQEFAERVVEALRNPAAAKPRALAALDYVSRHFSYTAAAARLAVDIPELERVVQGDGVLRR